MKLIDRYPRLPILVASTLASKIILIVKKRVIDPTFGNYRTAQKIQSWPPSTRKTAEWVMHVLSGVVRTMPERSHPVAIVFQEALAESLTNVGIKIEEISSVEQAEIIDATMPLLATSFAQTARDEDSFRGRLNTILGTAHDWESIFRSTEDVVASVSQKTHDHRAVRKARGLGRFL